MCESPNCRAEICDDQPGVGAGFPFPTDVGVPKFCRRVQLCPGLSHFPTLSHKPWGEWQAKADNGQGRAIDSGQSF